MKSRFFKSARKAISILMAAAFIFTSTIGSGFAVYAESSSESSGTASHGVLNAFKNPNYTDKPMARMWFPDAGAGLDDYDTIEKQIQELADGGFGGVEVTMLGNGTSMSNDEVKYVGWGTEAWRELLKKVLRAANSIDDGFTVDITITPHWPTVISSVDPNDAASQQEISYAYRKVVTEDVYSPEVELPLPETKTEDYTSAVDGAHFIFTDTLVSSALVKVDSIEEVETTTTNSWSGETTTTSSIETIYDFDSIIDLTDYTSEIEGEGYAAGVPDSVTASVYGWDYQDILDTWGDEPANDANFSQSFNNKVNTEGNRKRMADWQNFYQTDMTAASGKLEGYTSSEGDEIQPGDYVLVGIYRRGTGQVMSDGPFGGASILMYGRTYTTNYFCEDGVDAITDYWEKNILDDELRELLKKNGSSIFEDSIEAHTDSSFWSYNLIDVLEADNYQYTVQLPLVKALGASSFDTDSPASRIAQDYNLLLSSQYQKEHAKPIKDWAKTFNYTYRAQPYSLPGLDVGGASAALDIPEGDNSAKGDGLRYMSGAVNMTDKLYLSMEAVTATGNLKLNWADVATEVAQNYSHGVNHVILHGTPYNKTYNGRASDWPGWLAFGNNFAGSYTYRQTYWDDVESLSGYMARNQAVLATGTAKVDFAILQDITSSFSTGTGNEFQDILDTGYSYNILSEALVNVDNANVTNNVLYEAGPAYKALVLDSISTISVETLQSLVDFADAGLPIILYNTNPTAVYSTETSDNNDTAMSELFDELSSKDNVFTADSEEKIMEYFDDMSVNPYASYNASYLETSLYVDSSDGSNYYYVYNNPMADNSGMSAGKGADYKAADKIETEVTLEGEGTPYILDAWTGEVTPIVDYTKNSDGTISTKVELSGGDSLIIAIINDNKEIPYVVDKTGGEVVYQDGDIVLRSNTPRSYYVKLSNGVEATAVVDNELEDIDLSDASWNLEIESFGPDIGEDNIQDKIVSELDTDYTIYKDPSKTIRTTVNFEDVTLGDWSDLPATEEQLDELGVDSMSNVSGIGYYTTTFDLPEGWSDTTGAYINFSYNQDEVTEITVNNNIIDNVNIVTDRADIGKYLVEGENTITIKLCNALFNRALVEAEIYTLGGMMMSGTTPTSSGLTAVSLEPYTEINIDSGDAITVETTYTVGTTENAAVLVGGKMLEANSVITNNDSGSKEALLIVALYDEDGTMVNISYIAKRVDGYATEKFNAGFKLPSDIVGYKAKSFVWDGKNISTSEMTPLSNVTEITD